MAVKNDFCDRLAALLRRQPYDEEFYKELYCIMRLVCEETCPEGMACPDFFSLLEAVCDSRHIPKPMADGLQALRRKSNSPDRATEEGFMADARLLVEFIAFVCGKPVSEELRGLLSGTRESGAEQGRESCLPDGGQREFSLLRVRVVGVAGHIVTVRADSDNVPGIVSIDCGKAGVGGCLTYIAGMVHEGSVLNLLDVSVTRGGECVPQWIIFEPDYLVSPSDVAAVFEPQGASPYNYFVRMFTPPELSLPLLLGVASGVFLDDLLAEAQNGGGKTAAYSSSIQKVFRKMPIEFSLFMADAGKAGIFHREAEWQFDNMRCLLRDKINAGSGFCLGESLLEPSLVCPQVGLAGRMDFLQSDGSRLIEHKSGKRDEFSGTGRKPHLVQLMLYRMMVERCMGLEGGDIHAYLLYSRYSDGLTREKPDKALLYRALEMRNRIVGMIGRIANGKLGDVMTEVATDEFRIGKISDRLWSYVKPRLDRVFGLFAGGCNGLACTYAVRFCAFLMKESWYAKTGCPTAGIHGYADLWNSPAMERMANGDMLAGLAIQRVVTAGDRIESIVFALPADEHCRQSNFRPGDAVQIYCYSSVQPNVSSQCTFRGRMTRIVPAEAEVVLANPQHRLSLFNNAPGRYFAIEHDHIDSGNAVLCSSLFSFMELPSARQDNFLLTELPERGIPGLLCGSYQGFDELVALERASREWFLVIGPPGSGKTSRALRYMAEEELRVSPHTRIMMLAYTNKAVDEICAMLENIVADTPELLGDYLRLGRKTSASPEYHRRMLDSRVAHGCGKARDVRDLLARMRVVVATVSTMSQQTALLDSCDFEVAFIDEASQIIEPYILPVYTRGRIRRYVLVGDQKQLPAVVVQSRSEAAVTDEALNRIGIHDCSESLFCRMLHRFMSSGRSDLYCQIKAQGRMHPDLFKFVNSRFYGGTLECVPLKHQKRDVKELYPILPSFESESGDFVRRLARNRVVFLDCPPIDDGLNDKVNLAEARAVADCVAALYGLCKANNRILKTEDVGVIVPYRNQISMIRACLRRKDSGVLPDIAIDTVERYQGSQRDIIIYSLTVRHASQMRFLMSSVYNESDGLYNGDYPVDRKLNVALTRAREQMILIGNRRLLEQSPLFRDLIDMCDSRLHPQSGGNSLVP